MTAEGEPEEEYHAVHYLKTGTWELELLYPPDPDEYGGGDGPEPEYGGRFVELVLSDVPTREEFDVRLAAMGLRVAGPKKPYPGTSSCLELFRTERLP